MNHPTDDKITNPLSIIEDDHCWQLVLCDALEHIADQLPHGFEYPLVTLVSEVLKKAVHQHNLLEEEALFPVMLPHIDHGSYMQEAFEQLRREHETDEEHALEIAHQLDLLISDEGVGNPEMLGYMLRGFFESLRRHIQWENQTILPLANDLLTTADLNRISRWISNNPETSRCRRLVKLVGHHLGHMDCPYSTLNVASRDTDDEQKHGKVRSSNDNIALSASGRNKHD